MFQQYNFRLKQQHQNPVDIAKIEDPILRQICLLGFTRVFTDCVPYVLRLVMKNDDNEYRIDLRDFERMCESLVIKKTLLYSGENHEWISDANGDAEKFDKFMLENKVVYEMGKITW